MVVFMFAISTVSGATTLYVDDDASPGGDGLGWSTAFKYLQDGLAAASYGDEIHVAQGLYIPDQNSANPGGTGDREATFQLISGVVLKGSYAGPGQPDPDLCDVDLYETILSGDLAGNDVEVADASDLPDESTRSENSYHVTVGSNTDTNTVLDGFTITAGNAKNRYGGGMYSYPDGNLIVTNCTFIGNSAEYKGGGLYSRTGSASLTNCSFVNNSAYNSGGGIWNSSNNLTLTNCTFTGNYSVHSWGGGMGSSGSAILTNCVFINNSAGQQGGGMCNRNSTSVMLTNCIFLNNWSGIYGGGMYNYRSESTLINCIFGYNSADSYGGGIYSDYNSPTFINCTITENSAISDGGGIYGVSGSGPILTNCILWGNKDYGGWNETSQVYGDTPVVSYSCIQGLDTFSGDGNTGDNPLFLDADGSDNIPGTEDDNLRLSPGSGCLDAGDNSAVPPSVVVDLDGNLRFIDDPITPDTGNPGTPPKPIVDMGAYEGPSQGFLLSKRFPIIPEGQTVTLTVAIAMDPLGTVNVTVARESGDEDIYVESGSSLTFDSSNYWIPQTVTLGAVEDGDNLDGTAVIIVSASGFIAAAVNASEQDNGVVTPVIYVDDSANGDNNGANWTDAYTILQDALSIAVLHSHVEEIRVAQGIYKPDQNSANPSGTGDREATFQLINGITFKGGYAGVSQPDPNVRDINVYETVLSGNIGLAAKTDNCYHVVIGSGTDETAVLDGFTITAGNANGSALNRYGGGICNYNGSPIVNNCTLTDNSAVRGGGGISNDIGSSPTIISCSFIGNSALHGGGMYCSSSGSGQPMLINCIFRDNSAEYNGGGVRTWHSTIIMINCVFSGNTAASGGGIWNGHLSYSILENCILVGNSAQDYGGGLCIYTTGTGCQMTARNCIMWDNSANEGPQMSLDGGTITVTFCNILGGNLDIYDPAGILFWGEGNIGEDFINDDPLFVDADNDDYHLKSEAGRWDPVSEDWVIDGVTSPCIDAGNPGCPLRDEPVGSDNVRINMGVHGGTVEASKTPANWASLADLTNDHKVDISDLLVFVRYWLDYGQYIPSDLNRNESVSLADFAFFADQWLWEQ